MDAAAKRLLDTHGRGITNAAVSLELNLSNLADMSKSDCTRAIDLAAAVRRGDAWRRERLRMTDEDYGLVALAMAQHTANLPSWDAPPPPQPAPQVPEPQPQPPPPPPEPQTPGTVRVNRQRPSTGGPGESPA